jgi:cytoskeleton protein RodZ
MSSERSDQPATPDNAYKAPFPGGTGVPGQVLAAQREAMGWSVEQVADQLKLAVRQVIALEAGDYAALPSPAVTRGFVRAYAKLMKLDPAPLVAQIAIETMPAVDNTSHTARRASPTSFSESRFPNHNKRSRLPLGIIAAAVLVVAAGALAWRTGVIPLGQHAEHADNASATVALPASASASGDTATPGAATETLQNPAVPLISVPGASVPAASAPADGVVAPNTAVPAATPAVTAPATAAAAVATPAAAPAGAAGPNALVLNVRQDSWVEVRPARGGPALISRLVKGGSVETVNVDGPVRVVVGNPTGVSVTLRGEPVALPPVPGKTVSRVSLQ